MLKIVLLFMMAWSVTLNGLNVADFQNLPKEYINAKEVPPKSIEFLIQSVPVSSITLDIACQNGRSTRQLFAAGLKNVVGCDKDTSLLEKAKALNTEEMTINYVQGDIKKKLPFSDEQFELVTAFNSFQTFSDDLSINEVGRILKPKGYYFICRTGVTTSDAPDSFQSQVRILLDPLFAADHHLNFAQTEKGLESPEDKFLYKNWKVVFSGFVPYKESYTLEEVITHLQAYPSWNFVKNTTTGKKVLEQIKELHKKMADENGKIKCEGKVPLLLVQKN